MRQWRFRADPDATPGALFGYLAAGKQSVVDGSSSASAVYANADVIITDLSDGANMSQTVKRTDRASAVIVSVTPFGNRGPFADAQIPVNDFILQAMCGSIGGRGWPGDEPFFAGGRIGEWVAGSVAAVTAAACVRRARLTGHGEVVEVSTYESMVMTLGALGAMGASVLGDDLPVSGRSLEIPSIVPTADGLVGFCTITAQQFQDFLVLIDRTDLLDDADLASFRGRLRRREEFANIVEQWAATRTTDEVIDVAAALRIPVAPVATPETVTAIDHFVERGVFIASPTGTPHPRVPYRSSAIQALPVSPPPEMSTDRGQDFVDWSRARDANQPGGGVAPKDGLPLSGIRVADLTAFWAGPVATSVLAALGADVVKIEGVRRPDGMRFANGRPPSWDQWWEWGPVYLASNTNKRGISLELSIAEGREVFLELLAHCDLVVENFSPRVMANFGLEWDDVRAANPTVSMVRMPAFGLDGPWRDRVGFAQTMEQASGMAWMTGWPDGPPVIPRGVCDPVAGLHAAFAAIAALELRDVLGQGIHVESTMVEAALNVSAEALIEASSGTRMPMREGNRGPGASPQGVFRCEGTDEWVAVAVLCDDDWPKLATAIGESAMAADPSLRTEYERRERADELDKIIGAWTARRSAAAVVDDLRRVGVAAAAVVDPADLLTEEQLDDAGYWETIDHPVAGRFKTTGMPFTFASRSGGWITSPAPRYGEHTHDVLIDLLGKSEDEVDRLESLGVTAPRPAGL